MNVDIVKAGGFMERQAEALATVASMHDALAQQREQIAELEAKLRREEDRCTILVEERNKYRTESLFFRDKLVTLATVQANIGLLSVQAQEIMKVVEELNHASGDHNDNGGQKV